MFTAAEQGWHGTCSYMVIVAHPTHLSYQELPFERDDSFTESNPLWFGSISVKRCCFSELGISKYVVFLITLRASQRLLWCRFRRKFSPHHKIRPLLKREIRVTYGYVLIYDLYKIAYRCATSQGSSKRNINTPGPGFQVFSYSKKCASSWLNASFAASPVEWCYFFKCSMVSFDCIWLKSSLFKPSVPKKTQWFHSSQETFPDCLPSLVLVTSNLKRPRNFFLFLSNNGLLVNFE